MKTQTPVLFAGGLATLLFLVTAGCGKPEPRGDRTRGEYLVTRVGMCQDCHSPRDEKGAFLMDRWLTGAPLPFQPTVAMPWVPVAPSIAGLPNYTADQAVTLLTGGAKRDGNRSLPPMPEFRFSPEDARDVIAYLRAPTPPAPPAPAATN